VKVLENYETKFDPRVYAYSKQNYNFVRLNWKIKKDRNDFKMLINFEDPFNVFL